MTSELKCEVCRRPCKGHQKRVGDVVTVIKDSNGSRRLQSIVDGWSFGHYDNTKLCIGVICNTCVELLELQNNN